MANELTYKQYSELDFQNIKDSLKTHLKSQDILKDFDFEGSSINVIMNLLAYNTQYNSYYLNMMASEKFIATAQKRESIVGAANNIGYVPYSKKSSKAYLSFKIYQNTGYNSTIIIPKNTKFSATLDGTSYTYQTSSNTIVSPIGSEYTVNNLEVLEGRLFTYKFTISSTDKFLKLPNKGIDTSRITVTVKQSISDINPIVYSKYTSIINLDAKSNVYFIQESSGGLYEIYFGDGILGKALSVGNIVSIDYYITEGSIPNGIKEFSLEDTITGISSISYTNIIPASNGAMEESIDSIRLSAPNNYQTQNRAITELDYEILIKKLYPNSKQVSAIGGERYNPIQYGKIFISILKYDLNILSEKDKSTIIQELKSKYSGMTVFPVIVDPYIIRLSIDTVVKYDNNKISDAEIKTSIFNTINNYAITELNSFKYVLRRSKFEALVDNSNTNILSNISKFKLYINTNDSILLTNNNIIKFNQQILQKSIVSSIFTYKSIENCEFIDLYGNGFASVYKKSSTNEYILILLNVLSIDYLLGTIKYIDNSYSLTKLSNANFGNIMISVSPFNDDITVTDNYVLFVNNKDIKVSTIVDV